MHNDHSVRRNAQLGEKLIRILEKIQWRAGMKINTNKDGITLVK